MKIRSFAAAVATLIAIQGNATEIKLANWGVNVDHQTTEAQRQEFRDLVTANAPDFAFFASSGATTYFVNSDFGDYSVRTVSPTSSNHKYVFFFYDKTRWTFVSEHKKTYTWGRGVFVGEVMQDSATGEQYALVFCLDSFKDSQSYSTTLPVLVKEMTNDCVNARILLSYNTPKITDLVDGGFAGAGYTLQTANDYGALFSTGDDQPLTSVSSTLSGTAYTATAGFMATLTYPSKYRVRFNDWDGTELQSTVVNEHDSVTPPTDPEREGYEFTGWDHATEEFADVTANITATAQYKLLDTNFMVTFTDWDDSTNGQVSVTKNTPVARPDDPVRPYYTFRAWMNGDADWNFAEAVASNLVLKADYTLDPVQNVADADELVTVLAAGLPDSVIIRLANDVDFTGVAYTPADFSGILDGNGHYITGLPNNGKLFATLYGTVYGLTMKDIGTGESLAADLGVLATSTKGAMVYDCVLDNVYRVHQGTNRKCGGFFVTVDKNDLGVGTVISNCIVRNSRILTHTGDSQLAGGFAATASNTAFVDCRLMTTNGESVTVGGPTTYAGGIVAKTTGVNVTFVRCSAEGWIEASKAISYEWGGAAGILGSATDTTRISNCTNDAKIVVALGNGGGGIVGRGNGTSKSFVIEGACNRGDVVISGGTASGRGSGVGGVIGGVYGGSDIWIDRSVNYGTVSGSDAAGGLAGFITGGGNTDIRIVVSNSFNYGSVNSDTYAGGIVGNLYCSNESRLLNVGNSGSVYSEAGSAGGLLGNFNAYGNNDKLIADGIMQAGSVSTITGKAALGIGCLDTMGWKSDTISFRSAILAGSATATGGQFASLCAGFSFTENSKSVSVAADEFCRLLGTYAVSYYDNEGLPQTMEITPMTAADLTNPSGSLKILNDNATAQGYATWMCGKTHPELSLFCMKSRPSGLTLIFR